MQSHKTTAVPKVAENRTRSFSRRYQKFSFFCHFITFFFLLPFFYFCFWNFLTHHENYRSRNLCAICAVLQLFSLHYSRRLENCIFTNYVIFSPWFFTLQRQFEWLCRFCMTAQMHAKHNQHWTTQSSMKIPQFGCAPFDDLSRLTPDKSFSGY